MGTIYILEACGKVIIITSDEETMKRIQYERQLDDSYIKIVHGDSTVIDRFIQSNSTRYIYDRSCSEDSDFTICCEESTILEEIYDRSDYKRHRDIIQYITTELLPAIKNPLEQIAQEKILMNFVTMQEEDFKVYKESVLTVLSSCTNPSSIYWML